MKQTTLRQFLKFNITALVITIGVLLGRQGWVPRFPEPEGADWQGHFHPKIAMAKGNLVFVGRGKGGSDIYRLNLMNGQVIPLTNSWDVESDVTISPDGTKIAYVQYHGYRTGKIVCSQIDGSEKKIIDETEVGHESPLFSQNGDAILYAKETNLFNASYPSDNLNLYSYNLNDSSTRKLTNRSSGEIDNPQFIGENTLLYSYWNSEDTEVEREIQRENGSKNCFATVNIKSGAMKFGKDVFGNAEFASYHSLDVYPLRDRKFLVFLRIVFSNEQPMKVLQKTANGYKLLFQEKDMEATSVAEGEDSLLIASGGPSLSEDSGLILFSLKDGKKTQLADFNFFRHPSSYEIAPAALTALRHLQRK